jgi:hypothetical protein
VPYRRDIRATKKIAVLVSVPPHDDDVAAAVIVAASVVVAFAVRDDNGVVVVVVLNALDWRSWLRYDCITRMMVLRCWHGDASHTGCGCASQSPRNPLVFDRSNDKIGNKGIK